MGSSPTTGTKTEKTVNYCSSTVFSILALSCLATSSFHMFWIVKELS